MAGTLTAERLAPIRDDGADPGGKIHGSGGLSPD